VARSDTDSDAGQEIAALDNACIMCYINNKSYIHKEGPMTRLMRNITETLVDAALLEEGVDIVTPDRRRRPEAETLEENLVEVAFAEAADYDDIHEAILREHRSERDIAHPDDCQYGDNDLCFV
jgi:hypothetical protein